MNNTPVIENIRDGVTNRRSFMKKLAGGVAGLGLGTLGITRGAAGANAAADRSRVSFQTGTDHRDVVAASLEPLRDEIGAAIEGKQVVIKVNMGQIVGPLNATHPDTVQGILDVLAPISKKRIIIAESTAGSGRSTLEGFKNFRYDPILKEHKAKFVDLNEEPFSTMWIKNENNHPLGINIIDTFRDPDVYMISATRLKSHNCVIATLSLKNIVMASPVNHYKRTVARGRNEKSLMHSGGNQGLSYNLFHLALKGVTPDLAVLDGVVGMEGDGPVWGTPVEHGVALASTDWLAADRIGVELMGMNYDDIMYLRWSGQAGLGNDDLAKIDCIGPDPWKYVRTYRLHQNIEQQLDWVRTARTSQDS